MSDREKDLQAEELADLARRLETALDVDAPEARSEKALFVAGIGANKRRHGFGPLVPALAAVVLLVAIGIVSRTAQPGQALFPVRKALDKVGLAPSATNEIRDLLDRAERIVVQAESSATSAPTRVEALVHEVWAVLDEADELVGELDSDRRDSYETEIDVLEERAEAAEDRADETIDAREEAEQDAGDSSGSGSGSGGDDSSGSGSGGDDSSGSGSGSDDDSSGSGSGGDDSSGSGSGGDDSSGSGSGGGDDSSGSGSGGSGGDDSSGSGSGDDG